MIPSVAARVDRAAFLAEQLYARCYAWAAEHPPRVTVERGSDGVATWYAEVDQSVPVELPILAGEVVHHLRASLDHTMWALVEACGGSPGRSTQFPVDVSAKTMTVALKDLPPAAREIVRDVQADGVRPSAALHAVLAYSNVDKHRALYATQATAVVQHGVFEVPPPNDHTPASTLKPVFPDLPSYARPDERRWLMKISVPEGTDLKRLADAANFTWHHDVEFSVTWERYQGGGPSKSFARMTREVRSLLDEFDAHFPAG
jgi:hypothetical protein